MKKSLIILFIFQVVCSLKVSAQQSAYLEFIETNVTRDALADYGVSYSYIKNVILPRGKILDPETNPCMTIKEERGLNSVKITELSSYFNLLFDQKEQNLQQPYKSLYENYDFHLNIPTLEFVNQNLNSSHFVLE